MRLTKELINELKKYNCLGLKASDLPKIIKEIQTKKGAKNE